MFYRNNLITLVTTVPRVDSGGAAPLEQLGFILLVADGGGVSAAIHQLLWQVNSSANCGMLEKA